MASKAFEQWWDHFVQTGDICPLTLGQERRQVEALFGRPDDFSADAPIPTRPRSGSTTTSSFTSAARTRIASR